jgi:hypothetical protein
MSRSLVQRERILLFLVEAEHTLLPLAVFLRHHGISYDHYRRLKEEFAPTGEVELKLRVVEHENLCLRQALTRPSLN